MIGKIFLLLVCLSILTACYDSDQNSMANCERNFFDPKRTSAQVLDNEHMVLKRVINPDTTFFYLEWLDANDQLSLLIFHPGHKNFLGAESLSHYYVSGDIKASCPSDPSINGVPTQFIDIFNAEKISHCIVNAKQPDDRPLTITYWRFLGFRTPEGILSPTCEENFLYLVFTTSQVNPVNPDDRYFAEIYNGVNDCVYIYRLLAGSLGIITRSFCYREELAPTTSSEKYGNRYMQGLLDPDAIHISHSGSTLVIRPENMTDEMIFVGL